MHVSGKSSILLRSTKQARFLARRKLSSLRHRGSRKDRGTSPEVGTKFGLKVFMDAHSTVTAEEGDRYPLGPPNYRKIESMVDKQP